MGKKRNASNGGQHASASFGQMVSKAALAQMQPQIQQMVNQLGQRIAMQSARTLEMQFSRIVVLEKILMEKYGYTDTELASKFSDVEDTREGRVATTNGVTEKDLVRLSIQTKLKVDKDFQGISKMKLYNTGKGDTLGTELEASVLGMKAGETKELEFGQNNELIAKIYIDRVSAPIEVKNEDPAKG